MAAIETTSSMDPILRVDYLRPSRSKIRSKLAWSDEEAEKALERFRKQRMRDRLLAPR